MQPTTNNVPAQSVAEWYMREAEAVNPGAWVQHSIYVAEAARAIAAVHPDLDPTAAYTVGYLHDIGRRVGVTGLRHMLDGYRFLQGEGYEFAARICLTHGFPLHDALKIDGTWDCNAEELDFVQQYLASTDYTLWDRLIQLCDALALPSGFCLLEKRFVEVALRYGVGQHTTAKWSAVFATKADIETTIGCSIYSLLPGVVENTFDF